MKYIVEDAPLVAERAATLGCAIPDGLALLPLNFDTAATAADFLYDSPAATIRTLFRINQIPLQDILPPGTQRRHLSYKNADWVGQTLFIGSALLSDNGNLLSLALGVLSNYLTDFFKGMGKAPAIKMDLVIEKTHDRTYKRLKYEGTPEGLASLPEIIMALANEQ
jgi:hypothetical protein